MVKKTKKEEVRLKKMIYSGCVIGFVFIGILAILIFKKSTYEVTFVSDGETIYTLNIKKNDSMIEPKEPVKDGYKFIGWYLNGEKFDFSKEITKDTELEAKWADEQAILYTVSFNSEGGSSVKSYKVEKNSAIGVLPTPIKAGYKFVGWYDGTKLVSSNLVVSKNLNLVAKWEKDSENSTTKKTTKKTTTKAAVTTTKPVETTTVAVQEDKLWYTFEKNTSSTVGEGKFYLTKNGVKVAGTCDVVSITGETANISVPISGIDINEGEFVSVKNIKVN